MISVPRSKTRPMLLLCVLLITIHDPIWTAAEATGLRKTIRESITSACATISTHTSRRRLFTLPSSSLFSLPRMSPSTFVCHVLPELDDDTTNPVMAQTIRTTWFRAQTVYRLWYRDPLGHCTIEHCVTVCASSSTKTTTSASNHTEEILPFCPFLSTTISTSMSESSTACTCIAPGLSVSSGESTVPGRAPSPCSEIPNQVLDDQCRCTCRDGYAPNSTGYCVLKCANPYGNPCGPGSACQDEDNDVGYSCTPLYDDEIVCPVGCPPTEYCDRGTCRCKPGHVRKQPYLPCFPVET